MSRIRRTLVVVAAGTALALPAGCNEKDADEARRDVEREGEKAVGKAKEAERDIQNRDLP
jgi:uncharacterized membrane protein